MTTPSPTWYDVLGVSPDASAAEIKAAWRNATDKFEPGTGAGQFRMFNEAADVLLDPGRRTAYDESLAEEAPLAQEAGPVDELPPPPPPEPVEVPGSVLDNKVGTGSVREPASRTAWVVALILTLLTVAALAVAGYLALQVREDAREADARDEAPSAAERAAKAVFEYDYRHLSADRKRALPYLTGAYEKEYLKLSRLLEKQKDGTPGLALQTKTVLTATVLGSGLVDAEQDRARVLVYVNLVSKQGGKEPQIFQNRVAMSMKKEGDRWLLAKVDTY